MTPVIYPFDTLNGDLRLLSDVLAYAVIEKLDYEVLPGRHEGESYFGIQFKFETEEEAIIFKLKFPI